MKRRALTRLQVIIIAIVVIIIIAGVLSYFFLLAPSAPGPTLPPKDKIVVGYVDAFSGPFAAGAYPLLITVHQFFIEDVNTKGGLYVPEYGKRLPVELRTYDSKSDTETLIRLTEKAMVVDKVDLMFAPWGTSQNFAVTPLYEKYGYPLIAIACGSDQLVHGIRRGELKWVFLFLCQPFFEAKYIADFLQWAGAKTIGIIYVGDLHGIEHAGAFYRELYARGNIPVIYEIYPLGVEDLSPLIKKLMEANVDALIACSYPADTILLIKQSMALGFNPRIWISGPGTNYPSLMVGIFGTEILKGICFYHGGTHAHNTPELRELVRRYKERFNLIPTPHFGPIYAVDQFYVKAVEKYGLLDRTKIRDALAKETFDTVVGPAKFNMENFYFDFKGNGWVVQYQGGEMMEVVWPLEWKSADWIPKPPWPKG